MAKFRGKTVLFSPTVNMIEVEQHFDPTSEKAQSGIAVQEAIDGTKWRLIRDILVVPTGNITDIGTVEYNVTAVSTQTIYQGNFTMSEEIYVACDLQANDNDHAVGLYIKDDTTGVYTAIFQQQSSGKFAIKYTCEHTGSYTVYVQKENNYPTGDTTGTLINAQIIQNATFPTSMTISKDENNNDFALTDLYIVYTLPSAMSATKQMSIKANGTATDYYLAYPKTGTSETKLRLHAEKICDYWKVLIAPFVKTNGTATAYVGYEAPKVDYARSVIITQADGIPFKTTIQIYGKDKS